MAGLVQQTRAGYRKGDRVAMKHDVGLKPWGWRVVDFKGAYIVVVAETKQNSQFRNAPGPTAKERFKFYMEPQEVTLFPPPNTAKQVKRPGQYCGTFAARTIRRAKQAAEVASQAEQVPRSEDDLDMEGSEPPRTPAAAVSARTRRADDIYCWPSDCKCWSCSRCDPAQHCRCARIARCQATKCRARYH